MNGPELAVIMDPIASIDPVKDSTLAVLLLEGPASVATGDLAPLTPPAGITEGGGDDDC